MFKINGFIVLLLAAGLSACSPTIATRGNMISAAKFQQVKPQTSSRADVLQAWGPPTTTSPFDPNVWYYIGETTAQAGIFEPEVQKRRMIRVKFDTGNNDTVVEVADLDPKQAQNIDIVSRTTPTAGKEFTAVQQFVGNLGKFNQEAPKK
jgi:outer membrane protein assembly factor BamE (lipoprotein component of BamABCDE complex)